MADWYVSASGNDTTGAGTSGNPYATINKIQSVGANGDTIYVNPGSYGAWDCSKSFTMRPWPSTTGHIVFTGDPGNTHLCRINGATSFAILGTSRQHFQFTNTNTTANSTSKFALLDRRPPATTAHGHLFEYVDIMDSEGIGFRVERPQGVTIRHLYAEHCGNGLSLYNNQDDGQLYGLNVLLEDCWFRDMDKMVRNSAAASDYGGVGLNLERVSGSSASPITIKRLRTERCIAVRATGPGYTEEFDGAGIEFFASAYVLVDSWDSIDDKNTIETGTQEFGDDSTTVLHPREATLSSSVSAGASSFTPSGSRNTGAAGWRVGDCVYVDANGTSEEVIIDAWTGHTVTAFHLAGTSTTTFASSHSAGCRVSPAMPMEGNVFRNFRWWATGTRPTVDGDSTDGYIRGGLIPFMQDTVFHNGTVRGYDQFAFAVATPVGNDFPGATGGLIIRDCIIETPGGTDAKGQARRGVIVDDPALDPTAFDHNTYWSDTAGATLFRWLGSNKTDLTGIQGVGAETNGSVEDPDFAASEGTYLAATSPMLGISSQYDLTDTERIIEGTDPDRGGHERVLFEDRFYRTAAASIGTSTSNDAWDVDSGGASCSVSDGVLSVSVGSGSTIRANVASGIQNCEMLLRFRMSAVPDTEGTIKVYPTSHHTTAGNSQPGVRGELNVNISGTMGLVAAVMTDTSGTTSTMTGGSYVPIVRETFSPATWFWARHRVTENSGTVILRQRIWADGTDEPAAWDMGPATTTDASVLGSGGVGLRFNQSANNTAAITIDVSDMVVYTVAADDVPETGGGGTRSTVARSAVAAHSAAAARSVVARSLV